MSATNNKKKEINKISRPSDVIIDGSREKELLFELDARWTGFDIGIVDDEDFCSGRKFDHVLTFARANRQTRFKLMTKEHVIKNHARNGACFCLDYMLEFRFFVQLTKNTFCC